MAIQLTNKILLQKIEEYYDTIGDDRINFFKNAVKYGSNIRFSFNVADAGIQNNTISFIGELGAEVDSFKCQGSVIIPFEINGNLPTH